MINWVKKHKLWVGVFLIIIVFFVLDIFGVLETLGIETLGIYVIVGWVMFLRVLWTAGRNIRGICGSREGASDTDDTEVSGLPRIKCPECHSTNIRVAYGDRHKCGVCGKIFT